MLRINSCTFVRAAAIFAVLTTTCSFPAFAGTSGTWLQLSPANSPPARDVSAMAYDPASGKVVMFGGFNGVYLNDTWAFDGTNWTQVDTANAPSPRTSAMLAYDFASKKMVLFGGYNGTQFLGDTWIFDGLAQTWTQANPSNVPTAVAGAMIFTDPKNGHVDMFGGYDGRFYQLITWQWVNNNWVQLKPATSPGARGWAVIGTDKERKITVLSGGIGDVNTLNTWTWDGTNWTMQSPSNALPRVANTAAAYDPTFGVVVVFGGDAGNGAMNSSWAWTGNNWFLGQPQQSPPAREFEGGAYDYTSQQYIVFGGDNGISYLGDTWSLVAK